MKVSLKTLHRISALLAFLLITSFFTSTVISEWLGETSHIVWVKTAISYAVWGLIPLMAITGITGAKMAPNVKSGPIAAKKKRMPIIALNGLFILLPAALYLKHLAVSGQFDMTFYVIQGVEFVAGLTNITLMILSLRNAWQLTKKESALN